MKSSGIFKINWVIVLNDARITKCLYYVEMKNMQQTPSQNQLKIGK